MHTNTLTLSRMKVDRQFSGTYVEGNCKKRDGPGMETLPILRSVRISKAILTYNHVGLGIKATSNAGTLLFIWLARSLAEGKP